MIDPLFFDTTKPKKGMQMEDEEIPPFFLLMAEIQSLHYFLFSDTTEDGLYFTRKRVWD